MADDCDYIAYIDEAGDPGLRKAKPIDGNGSRSFAMTNPHKGRPSRRLTQEDAVKVWFMLWDGWLQSRIAAYFDVNIGRISEVKTGKRFPDSQRIALQRRRKAA